METASNLYHRVFPLYQPDRPFVHRLVLLHLVYFTMLSGVLFLGNTLEYLLSGSDGLPDTRLNAFVELLGWFSGLLPRTIWYWTVGRAFDWSIAELFVWRSTQDDVLELDWLYKMVLCAVAGWITWSVVGKKILEPAEEMEEEPHAEHFETQS